MQTFDPTEIDHALEFAADACAQSLSERNRLRRDRPPDRDASLRAVQRQLRMAGGLLRPFSHAQAWQSLHRADELHTAAAALKSERRLVRRLLAAPPAYAALP